MTTHDLRPTPPRIHDSDERAVMSDRTFLETIRAYIEESEEAHAFLEGQSLRQKMEKGHMPELYGEVCRRLEELG